VYRHRAGDDRQARQLTHELGEYQARLDALGEAHFVEGVVDRSEYLRARSTLLGRIESCQTALARRAQRSAVAGLPTAGEALDSWWEGAGLDQRRALVRLMIERVVVHPAVRGRNRFDSSRIEPVFQQ
jgi:site-specific DNA recombinase